MNKEKIIDYLIEHTDIIRDLVGEVNGYDGQLEDYCFYDNDEYFFRDMFGDKIDEAVRAVCYGNYEYMDDFVQFNAYGNLDSVSEYEYYDILKTNVEEIFDTFMELYESNNVNIYDNELKEMVDEYYEANNS